MFPFDAFPSCCSNMRMHKPDCSPVMLVLQNTYHNGRHAHTSFSHPRSSTHAWKHVFAACHCCLLCCSCVSANHCTLSVCQVLCQSLDDMQHWAGVRCWDGGCIPSLPLLPISCIISLQPHELLLHSLSRRKPNRLLHAGHRLHPSTPTVPTPQNRPDAEAAH